MSSSIELRRRRVAEIAARVDAHAGARRFLVAGDRARALRDDARLHGIAARHADELGVAFLDVAAGRTVVEAIVDRRVDLRGFVVAVHRVDDASHDLAAELEAAIDGAVPVVQVAEEGGLVR